MEGEEESVRKWETVMEDESHHRNICIYEMAQWKTPIYAINTHPLTSNEDWDINGWGLVVHKHLFSLQNTFVKGEIFSGVFAPQA